MTTEAEHEEPLDLTEDMEAGENEEQQVEAQTDPEEYTLEIEGEDADEDDADIPDEPEPSKKLRAKLRDRLQTTQREKFELEKRVTLLEAASAPAKIEVGERPTLDGCDYDDVKFEAELLAWHDRKKAADNVESDAQRARDAQQAEYQKDLNNYVAKKAALPIAQEKKDAAEKLLIDTLPQIMQSALIKYTDDPAKVAVALANAPQKLAALAKETDPIRFIIAVREMENKIVVNKKKPPAPESGTIVRGSAPMSASTSSKTLKKLEDEARATGDRTKLIDYKRSMKAKAA